ncbi:hypothetical protein D3C87_850930 [compost metagenome]
MEWHDKVKMIRASNADDQSLFKEVVLAHIETFDAQAWAMFFDCISLVKELIAADLDFYKKVNEQFHTVRTAIDIGWRADLRWAMMEVMIEEGEKE